MADKKNRLNTDAMFQSMIGQSEIDSAEKTTEEKKEISGKKSAESSKAETVKKEKNVQVSVYLSPDMIKEIRIQDALKSKENDKSALTRAGLSIILGLSDETYRKMKEEAGRKGISLGDLAEEAIREYLKIK